MNHILIYIIKKFGCKYLIRPELIERHHHSKMLTDWITEYVSFIAPVKVMAGENELESLSMGALRILKGEETAEDYRLR